MRPLVTSVCKSIFIAAVIGVIFPVKSKISATFETQFRLVSLDAMMFWCCTGFFPRCFLAKFNSPMSRAYRSFLENRFIPATLTLLSSVDRALCGSLPVNVIPFRVKPPRFNTSSSSSTLSKAFSTFFCLTSSHLHKRHFEQFD